MLTDGGTEAETLQVGHHFAYLKALAAKGVVLLAGRTLNADPSSFGIVIFLADDEAAAQAGGVEYFASAAEFGGRGGGDGGRGEAGCRGDGEAG